MKHNFSKKELVIYLVTGLIGWGFFLNSQGGIDTSLSERFLGQTLLGSTLLILAIISTYTAISFSISKSKILALIFAIFLPPIVTYISGAIYSLSSGYGLPDDLFLFFILLLGASISGYSIVIWLLKLLKIYATAHNKAYAVHSFLR